jgi:cytosine/adenosine deaminase-related metal-dependent hydrolase
MIFRARCILPVGQAPIDNAALVAESGSIQWLGRWADCPREAGADVRDLGEVVLLPGFVNAHCHLDYTSMAGKIPPPRQFPDWIKLILSLKAHWSYTEYAESWLKGAKMLLASGTTTVCDIEAFPELLPDVWSSTPLRVISFLEVTGVKEPRLAEERASAVLAKLDELPAEGKSSAGISPHALYSTFPETMKRMAAEARRRQLPLTTHLAESESEFEMFTAARGPLFEWLHAQRPAGDYGRASPIRLAHDYGVLGPRCLVAHANYLAPGDAELLALTGSTVVHCPHSHAYFSHDPFPWEALNAAGVNLCLGTDSLASTLKNGRDGAMLDMRLEMKLFSATHPGVRPARIFEMATLNGAKALGRTGQLELGANADFNAFEYTGPLNGQMYEPLLFESPLREVVIAGEPAHPAGGE